ATGSSSRWPRSIPRRSTCTRSITICRTCWAALASRCGRRRLELFPFLPDGDHCHKLRRDHAGECERRQYCNHPCPPPAACMRQLDLRADDSLSRGWLAKLIKLQRLRRPEPDHVLGVVLQRVARLRMGEDRKLAAVEHQPGQHVGKLLLLDGELAA